VNEPVEDAVGQRGIADLFVPARDRQLRNQDRGANLVAILADLPQVAALGSLTGVGKPKRKTIRSNVPPATGYNQAMAPTVLETKDVPATRREGIEAGGSWRPAHLRAVRGSDIGRSDQTRRADPRALSARCSFAQDEQPAEITRRDAKRWATNKRRPYWSLAPAVIGSSAVGP
jgi:hypothetical protein